MEKEKIDIVEVRQAFDEVAEIIKMVAKQVDVTTSYIHLILSKDYKRPVKGKGLKVLELLRESNIKI